MLNIGAMVLAYIVHLLLLLSEGRHIECIALAIAVEREPQDAHCYRVMMHGRHRVRLL